MNVPALKRAMTKPKHMSRPMLVRTPNGARPPAILAARAHPGDGLSLNRAEKRRSASFVGAYLLGVSEVTEGTPLMVVLVRLLFSIARLFRIPLNRSRWDKPVPRKLAAAVLAATQEEASGLPITSNGGFSPRGNRRFLRSWMPPRTGASFQSKRLMRMTHRHSNPAQTTLAEK
jgi:hypothetical protein